MQFDADSVQLSATVTELLERMRQAAYDEGYEDGASVTRSRSMARRESSLSSASSE